MTDLGRDKGNHDSDRKIQKSREERTETCPVCGAQCVQEKCKIVCVSETCIHRVVMNCTEF